MTIEQATLRSNPRYELVLLDKLGSEERELVAAAGTGSGGGGQDGDAGPHPYGLLRPAAGGGLDARLVSTDTALLFLTLREPGRCPAYVRAGLGERVEAMLGRLIVDGILEVERDGVFSSGGAAWQPYAPAAPDRVASATASLSIEALRYGAALTGVPTDVLGLRLYFYGRRPVTPSLRRRFPDDASIATYLVGDRSTASALRAHWQEARPAGDSPWRSWRPRRDAGPQRPGRPVGPPDGAAMYKLYVSAAVAHAPVAFGAIVVALADAPGVLSFKVGRSAEGLVRPDKAVAYFATQDDLLEGATRMRRRIDGLAAHGVPFTSGITADGLLAWGVDPPRSGRSGGDGAGGSWRSWLAGRLADYLVAARGAGDASVEPWRVAMERIRLDGIDPETWVPAAGAVR